MYLYRGTYRGSRGGQKTARVWMVEFYVRGRRFRFSTRTGDRRAAELVAAEAMKREELRAAGIETFDEARAEGLAGLVAEFVAELVRRGRCPGYVDTTGRRLRKVLDGLGELARATPEELRRRLGKVEGSPKTANQYRTALYGFFGWLRREGRWGTNPLDAVPRVRETEKTFDRRALTVEELARLLAVSPPGRATCYRLAATTGLRRGELGALDWSRVDLEAATVTARAGSAKNRREAVLPLAPATVAALLGWRALQGREGAGKVFDRPPRRLKWFRRDLEAAGIEYETEAGRADFHALRNTFATSLARAGVSLAMAQKLMRHSTPVLTANVYTRLELHDARAAVALAGEALCGAEKTCVDPRVDSRGEKASSSCLSVPLGAPLRRGGSPCEDAVPKPVAAGFG